MASPPSNGREKHLEKMNPEQDVSESTSGVISPSTAGDSGERLHFRGGIWTCAVPLLTFLVITVGVVLTVAHGRVVYDELT